MTDDPLEGLPRELPPPEVAMTTMALEDELLRWEDAWAAGDREALLGILAERENRARKARIYMPITLALCVIAALLGVAIMVMMLIGR